MEMNFEEVIAEITSFMKSEANADTIIGKAFELGEYSCVPVIRVGMGFGTGGGEKASKQADHDKLGNAGAGAGMGIEPIGFLVSRADNISFVSTKTESGIAGAVSKVPDLLTKLMDTRKKAKEVDVN